MKDASGRWWLLQVKAFRIKNRSHHHPDRPFSLPVKTRIQYLSYRDSSVLEDNSGSEDEDGDHGNNGHHHNGHSLVALAQRQVQKLVQCKCCTTSYPKSELSFKMTLKMINETLVRIRARLAPEKTYAFLAAALSCEPPDSSLAYESWSVCSFCYAIYERDQQLKRVEIKFSAILGVPNPTTAAEGLSRAQDRTYALDPNSIGSVLPPQLTLCRLVLVFNAIYDIPKELYDAEQTHLDHIPVGARKNKTLRTIASKLYLRITALGYTECIPLSAEDIEIASDKAPRGASLRKSSSTASDLEVDESTSERFPETNANDDGFLLSSDQKNYWLPINIIRTIPFVAPRTPLQSKLKETSGITSLLTEESSILVQFIRATEPPLQDPTTAKRRTKKRRAALIPEAASVSEMVSEMQLPHHSVLLGSTKIRLAQFRSAYVTKIDFYACMALSGEMFNIKGNIGLERLRYVDSKFLTSQYRLRMFHGVFIPDDSYMTNDPLSPEWMDSLRVSFHKQTRVGASQPEDLREEDEDLENDRASPRRHRLSKPGKRQLDHSKHQQASHTRSTTSLSNGDNDEMDEELEEMIERANLDQQKALARKNNLALDDALKLGQDQTAVAQTRNQDLQHEQPTSGENEGETGEKLTTADTHRRPPSIAELKHELLPSTKLPSRFDSQISMLLKKAVLSPRSAFADFTLTSARSNDNRSLSSASASSSHHQSQSPLSPRNVRRLWCLLVLLNEAHNLQSREHTFCRWECHYTLLGQKRSAVERHITSTTSMQVHFTCTHKFFVAGTTTMMQAFLKNNPLVSLHLRNDMYASTRARSKGEFSCQLSLSPLLQTPSLETTIDIHPTNPEHASLLTPREATAIANAAPYLSVAVHLSQLALDPDDATVTGDFLELSTTKEGLQVLRKIS